MLQSRPVGGCGASAADRYLGARWCGRRRITGDDLGRQPDDGGDAAGCRLPKLNPDAVAGGEATDCEQTHRPGHRHVDDRRVGQTFVDALEILGRHPDPAVLDFDHGARARPERVAGDLHIRCRRGERCGVLQQLGDEVHDVADGVSGDRDRRGDRLLDPCVLLDLGDGGEHDLVERDGVRPSTGGVGAGQNQQAFVVPAHTGGEVVELEQVGELVGVLLPVLQVVDQSQLAFDQALASSGQVDEHRVDVVTQHGLLGGETDGFPVDLVEGTGDFTDLLLGVDADRFDVAVDVLVGRVTQSPDRLGKAVAGDVQCCRAQSEQGTYQGPGDDHRREQGGREDEHDEQSGQQRRALDFRAKCLDAVVDVTKEGGQDFAIEVHGDLGRLQPLLGVEVKSLTDLSRQHDLSVVAGL